MILNIRAQRITERRIEFYCLEVSSVVGLQETGNSYSRNISFTNGEGTESESYDF